MASFDKPLTNIFQRVGMRSPGRGGFSQEGARFEELYITEEPLSREDLTEVLRAIIGDVDRDGSGRLKRTLPAAHPDFPWLVARDVNIQYLGMRDSDGNVAEAVDADGALEVKPIVDSSTRYVRVELVVTFDSRPYDIVPDDQIEPAELTYYAVDDDATATGSFTNSKEYLRYTDSWRTQNVEIASFTLGQQVFRTDGGSAPGGSTPSSFPGTPFIVLPNGRFVIRWFFVPWDLTEIEDHPMWTTVCHVNQTTFFNKRPGSLLYLGPEIRRYQPSFPTYQDDPFSDTSTVFVAAKLCDIDFIFLWTGRRATDPPDLAAVSGNWIADGHNAQPWAKDRQFYTVTAPVTNSADNASPTAEWVPTYPSSEFRRLFECPEPE